MYRPSHQYSIYPFHAFLPLALSAFIYSFFRWGDSTGFQVGSTYFMVGSPYFLWAVSLFFMGNWAVYELIRKHIFSTYLTWLHVITTVLVVLLLATANIWHDSILPPLQQEFTSWKSMREQKMRESNIYLPIAATFLTGQTAFLANLLTTIWKRY